MPPLFEDEKTLIIYYSFVRSLKNYGRFGLAFLEFLGYFLAQLGRLHLIGKDPLQERNTRKFDCSVHLPFWIIWRGRNRAMLKMWKEQLKT